jgi:hypothetical protein
VTAGYGKFISSFSIFNIFLLKTQTKANSVHKSYYHHWSPQIPSKKFSLRKRRLLSLAGLRRFLLTSMMSPAALKRRSTQVLVAGGVRYLKK